MLTAIPDSAVASFRDGRTVGDWLQNGVFFVTACTRREISLETNPIDYGSVVLTECENLLNHCLEHLQEMVCLRNDTRLRSQAWAIVTAYYFGFFAASAFLRLIGQPIVFLTAEQLKRLQTLASATARPGQGAFRFEITKQLSLTRTEIAISHTDRVHEATWKSALSTLDQLNRDPQLTKSAAEALLYDSVCSQILFPYYDSFQWPSMVRNRANYRPGFMYQLHNPPFNFSKLFEVWRGASASDLHQILQTCLSRCGANRHEFLQHTDLMLSVASIVFLLARELYVELLRRRRIDRRWEDQRAKYITRMKVADKEYELFFASA
ncbi:MAG: hypothetical protein ABSH38_22125 [Verrucomicrobiota bacterium]